MERCICGKELIHTGKGRKPRYCSYACKQEAYRNRKEAIRNKRLKEQRSKLYVVPVSLKVANAFVETHHRHNSPVPIAKFSVGVADESGKLRGVVIVNNPIVPQLMDGFTLEVNRLTTDGCPNACSILYAAARKIAFAMGYRKLITYTLQEESGASMRGAGWKRVSEVQAHKGWSGRKGRKESEIYQKPKWRWETINPAKAYLTEVILPEALQKPVEDTQLELFG